MIRWLLEGGHPIPPAFLGIVTKVEDTGVKVHFFGVENTKLYFFVSLHILPGTLPALAGSMSCRFSWGLSSEINRISDPGHRAPLRQESC